MQQQNIAQIQQTASWGMIAAIFAFLSIAIGAFAAHGLKGRLSEYQLGIVETAAKYQMYHALAILAVCVFMLNLSKDDSKVPIVKGLNIVNFCWVTGSILFCGSLYALAFTGVKWLAFITPIGGLFFLIAWLWLAFVFFSIRKP